MGGSSPPLFKIICMADAVDMLESLRALDITAVAARSIEENEEVIADMMAARLARGKRADGTDILPDYKPITIAIKEETGVGLGAVTDHVTLFQTGAHYQELYADVQGEVIEYGSKDSKSEKLQKKYDTARGSIYGIDTDDRENLVEGVVGESWQKQIEQGTGLSFS